ncbi:MAG: hypothetical protein AAF222_04630 [Pseudomonadota bacterium]
MAFLYCALMLGTIGFQIALILGAPWGHLTQGGQTDGPLPARGRFAAALSILILLGMGLAILSADGRWPHWPVWTGWIAVAMNTVVMVLNWITPSAPERRLWGPITTVILLLSVAVVFL